jgi:hypothetical protein
VRKHPRLSEPEDILQRCPRLVAHVICESLGYATPRLAASIVADAHQGKPNWCEWIYSCFRCDPVPAVRRAIRGRHHHKGFMADYQQARAIVAESLRSGNDPLFASWF